MKGSLFCLLILVSAPWCARGADNTTAPAAPVAKYTLSTGFDYCTGDYGLNSTTGILAVPIVARCDVDRWTLKLIVSYLHVTGPGNVVTGWAPA